MTGTFLNVATVLMGGTVGALAGGRLPERFRQTAMHAIGLVTLLIGLQMALGTRSAIIVLGSVVVGALLGEAARIDHGLNALGDWVERQVLKAQKGTGRRGDGETGGRDEVLMRRRGDAATRGGLRTQDSGLMAQHSEPSTQNPEPDDGSVPAAVEVVEAREGSLFSKGFVTAALVFCVGPMTILGAFQDGLTGVYDTLAVKSILDGFTAIALASTLGWGVVFSSLVVLIYQGVLTLSAGWARPFLTEPVVLEMTAAGGLLIVGIGLNILGLTKIRVANMLPALLIAPLLVALFGGK